MIGAKEKMVENMNKRVKMVFEIFSLAGCIKITCKLENLINRPQSDKTAAAMIFGSFRFIGQVSKFNAIYVGLTV